MCEAISKYVRSHPDAADTAEGIVRNWLRGLGFADAPEHIDAVLEKMMQERRLCARTLPDGQVLYTRGDVQP